jgi:hypothetical protein
VAGEPEGVGVGLVESPEAVRRRFGVIVLEPEGDGVLLGSAAGVNKTRLEVELAGGWLSDRNPPRMLAATLGETVVVVVVLRGGLANTVTVTVTGSSLPLGLPVLKLEVEVDVEEEFEDVALGLVELFEPGMPGLPPEAFIRPITVLSLVQSRDVPGARRSGMAKHC